MSVHHNSLSISNLSIILESSSEEVNLLTKFGNALSIIVSEYIELEDTLSYIGSTHQVNLKELGLKMSLVSSVAFKSLKQESSGLLDAVVLKEHLHNAIKRSLWHTRSITGSNHLSKANSSLWVSWHNSTQDLHEVWLVTSLLAIRNDLIELVSFNQSLNDLIR